MYTHFNLILSGLNLCAIPTVVLLSPFIQDMQTITPFQPSTRSGLLMELLGLACGKKHKVANAKPIYINT